MTDPSLTGVKWFHLSWATARRRKLFKIAGASRFCERSIRDLCCRRGWWMGGLAVLPDRIHLLLLVPHHTSAGAVLEALKLESSEALRGHGPAGVRGTVWDRGSRCSEIRNPAVLAAVCRQINKLRLSGWGGGTDRSVRQ